MHLTRLSDLPELSLTVSGVHRASGASLREIPGGIRGWLQLHIPPLLLPCFPRSKVAPWALLPGWVLQAEAGGEKIWGRGSQRRMFPVLGVFLNSSHRCLEVGGCPCRESCFAGAASACKAPLKVSHQILVDFPSCTALLGKVKTYRRESRTESNKSRQLLGSLQPRNQLFIADACWQREDPIRQGNIFHEPGFTELLLLLPLVPGEIPGFHELCKDPAAARAGQGLPGQCWELEEPGSCPVLPRGAGSAWPCCCAGTGWGSAGGASITEAALDVNTAWDSVK